MTEHLSQACKILSGITPTAGAAGTTPVNGTIVDMSGFEGCLMIFSFGAIVAGAVTSVKAQRGDDSGLSDAADIAGSAQTVADNTDDTVFYIDVYRPRERYVRGICSRGTQQATVQMTYILYGAREKPVTQPSGVSGERHVDATEGTA